MRSDSLSPVLRGEGWDERPNVKQRGVADQSAGTSFKPIYGL